MIYPLFGFEDSRIIVISRGRSSNEAFNHIESDFPKGSTISEMTALPINATKLYDRNHSPGWLTRKPSYLKEE